MKKKHSKFDSRLALRAVFEGYLSVIFLFQAQHLNFTPVSPNKGGIRLRCGKGCCTGAQKHTSLIFVPLSCGFLLQDWELQCCHDSFLGEKPAVFKTLSLSLMFPEKLNVAVLGKQGQVCHWLLQQHWLWTLPQQNGRRPTRPQASLLPHLPTTGPDCRGDFGLL